MQWLKSAGLINIAYNISIPELPLSGYSDPSQFKVYMLDAGLFGAMLNPISDLFLSGRINNKRSINKRIKYPIILIFILCISITALFSEETAGLRRDKKNASSGVTFLKDRKTPKTVNKMKNFMFLAYGTINFGDVLYYPYKPVVGDYTQYTTAFGPNSQVPYDFSYSFGMGLDYRVTNFLGIFFDGGYNTWKLLLAEKDGYAYGQWVAETTDWANAVVGIFTMDTYYYMDTTSMRLGVRYVFSEGILQPWAGAAAGVYAWEATIGNRELGLKYGDPSSGFSPGYSILAGIDFVFDDIILRIYGDYGSAVGKPTFTGLLADYPDAVFNDTGGEFVAGLYKAGCAVGFKY